MPKRHGNDANIPGNHRAPMDFKGVEQDLLGKRGGIRAPEPVWVQGAPISAMVVAGFGYHFLRGHYDRYVESPHFHWEMWGLACVQHPLVAIAAPREHAKSTAITFCYGLAMLMFRNTNYIVVVSDTFEGQAVEHIRDYRRELTENAELIAAFNIKSLIKDTEGDLIGEFTDGNKFRIKALGMEGPIRGLKWRGARPGLFLIDDAENPELVDSKIRRDKSRNWIMKDLIPAGRQGAKVRMVGTILHHDASLARFCRDDEWMHKIYRAHKAFNDFNEILWPQMWSEERLRRRRQMFINQNDSDGYSQEYLNDPISPTDAYFRLEDLLTVEDRDLYAPGIYYIGWDFAVSKEEKRDYSVGTLWKIDERGFKVVMDACRGRWDAKEIVDKIFEWEELYSPRAHFSEKGTIDHAIGPFLEAEMTTRESYPNIVKITRNKDKETFAKPLQGMIRVKNIAFNKKMDIWPDVEDEMRKFLKGGHDDIVDALAIVAQGLRDLMRAPSLQDVEEEDYFNQHRESYSQQGRHPDTGY